MDTAHGIATRTLYGECRGEPEAGQRAVASVLVNRLRTGRWGKTLLAVCLSPWQFSCWNPSDPNRKLMCALDENDPVLARFASFLTDAESGTAPDLTGGALYYKVTSLPWPKDWGAEVQPTAVIGNHAFYILKE